MNHETQKNDNASRPTISVCIGAYNRERYIRECIDSVLNQTRPADEIVVVDDASTDGTVDILKSYGDRIRLICRGQNSGNCAAARNDGMRASNGDYIAFLDSDDAWFPTKLEKQCQFMEEHSDVTLSHTYCELMNGLSHACGIRHQGRLTPGGDEFEWLLDHCWISTSTVMFRRSILAEVGMMNEDARHRIGEDWEFYLRIAKQHRIGLVDEVLARYRKSEAGISTTDWRHTPRSVVSRLLILEDPRYWSGRVQRRVVVDKLVDACRDSSIYWRGQGHPERARWFDAIWLKHRPWDGRAWLEWAKTFRRCRRA